MTLYTQRSQISVLTKGLFLSHFVHKRVQIHVSEKIIIHLTGVWTGHNTKTFDLKKKTNLFAYVFVCLFIYLCNLSVCSFGIVSFFFVYVFLCWFIVYLLIFCLFISCLLVCLFIYVFVCLFGTVRGQSQSVWCCPPTDCSRQDFYIFISKLSLCQKTALSQTRIHNFKQIENMLQAFKIQI